MDLDPLVTPLLVRTSPGGLALAWEDRPGDEYMAREGTIRSLWVSRAYDHGAIAATCRQPAPVREIPSPDADSHDLVTESWKFGSGSSGRGSFGRESPPTIRGCP